MTDSGLEVSFRGLSRWLMGTNSLKQQSLFILRINPDIDGLRMIEDGFSLAE